MDVSDDLDPLDYVKQNNLRVVIYREEDLEACYPRLYASNPEVFKQFRQETIEYGRIYVDVSVPRSSNSFYCRRSQL